MVWILPKHCKSGIHEGKKEVTIDWYDSKSSTNGEAPLHPQSFGHFTASGSEILRRKTVFNVAKLCLAAIPHAK